MSYPTHHTGRITITPPLTWAEIKAGPELEDVRLVLDKLRVEDEHGYRDVVTAAGVEARTTEEFSGYRVREEIEALVAMHVSHAFAGHIECCGPDGDLWRYVVRDREVARVEPRIVWST